MNGFSAVRAGWRAGLCLFAASCIVSAPPVLAQAQPARKDVEAGMKRATQFMVDKVAYRGGYLWNYLPDMSRRWGEMEARETMIWLQPPGTSSMGHVFLDAYHATGDEYYYRAAEQVGIRPDLGSASERRLELRGGLRGRPVLARLVCDGGQERVAPRGVPALLRQRHLRRPGHHRRRHFPAAALRGKAGLRATRRRSTRPSSSCSTASIPSARGRSASR